MQLFSGSNAVDEIPKMSIGHVVRACEILGRALVLDFEFVNLLVIQTEDFVSTPVDDHSTFRSFNGAPRSLP